MKKQLPGLFSFILMFSLFSCEQNTGEYPDTTQSLLSQIVDPSSEYRTAPLWDWNDIINKEDIKFQMEEFKNGGLGGVFIHRRPGLVSEY